MDFLNKYHKTSDPIIVSISSDVKYFKNEYYIWFEISFIGKKTVKIINTLFGILII